MSEIKAAMQKAMWMGGYAESLISECGSIFDNQLRQGAFPPSFTLPLFNNLENKHNLEVVSE